MASPNIANVIFEGSASWRDKPALIAGKQRVSYGELVRGSQRLAAELQACGIRPADRVAFLCADGVDYVLLSLAVLSLSAAIVPISPNLMLDECAALLDLLDVRHFLADVSIAGVSHVDAGVSFTSPELEKTFRLSSFAPRRPEPTEFANLNPAFIRFSSGTTGASKGVVLSHQAILERTDAANAGLQITAEDTIGWVLSMSFHFVVTILLFLRKGAAIVLCGAPLPGALLTALSAHSLTVLYASPIHYRLLSETSSLSPAAFCSLRLAISTAIQLPEALAKRFFERFSKPLSEAYGIIEVGLPFVHTPTAGACAGHLGKPLPAFEIQIAEDGEVLIRGAGLFDAYFSPWQLRAEVAPDGWFHTGDMGEISPDGSLRLLGRKKAMINFSGMKIFPEEVEHVVLRFPGVAEVRVWGEPQAEWGEVPQAMLVVKDGCSPLDISALQTFCRAHLAAHKVPKSFEVVARLPKTASGKIRRA